MLKKPILRKLICLVLGLLLSVSCFSGLAESGETYFLRIRENRTANVYANPGDETPVDSLNGGGICGLLEETPEAGTVWFHVFYLSGDKKSKTGYLNGEDAERLSQDELTAMLENPEQLDRVLDLVDAVNSYLQGQEEDDTARTGAETDSDTDGSQTDTTTLNQFYSKAMEALQELSDRLDSVNVPDTEETLQEIGDKVISAGKDLLDQARVEGRDSDLTEIINEVNGKLQAINLKEKLEEVNERLNDSSLNDSIDALTGKLDDSGLNESLEGLQQKTESQDLLDQLTGVRERLTDISLEDVVGEVLAGVTPLMEKGNALSQSLRRIAETFGFLLDGR